MKLEDLEKALEKSWSKETCYPELRDEWSPDNPALGQCAVTSLVVQDYFGGKLLYCKHQHHYWNKISSGEEVDFTRDQFPEGAKICLDEIKERKYLLNSESSKKAQTPQRYEILKERVDNEIKKNVLVKYYQKFLTKYEEEYGDRILLIAGMEKLSDKYQRPKIDPVHIEEDDLKLLTNNMNFKELKKVREKFVKNEMKDLTERDEDDPYWEKFLYFSPIEEVMAMPFASHKNLKFGGKFIEDFMLVLMEDEKNSNRMYYHIFKIE